MKVEGLVWHPQEYVTVPRDRATVSVHRDSWWMTNDAGEIAIYRRFSPQCNSDRRITQMLLEKIPGATGMVQIPLAFVPVNTGDYE